ncbi:hypothetical protein AT246_01055 [Bartonella henselae]|uniref:Hypothetical membrane protein n=1 Tax=Bartonella henselae TaxID=38323 RepID=X5MEV0_BARHN|nr:hypothetical protein [Bartonella henselae]MDM9996071.1 hypothetical protein [Bartonella henselae]OLL48494.1 hypothetical protein AT241_03380 [Bartonella henselae]OLL48822.1 hypothetical protein AT247_01600 [Bartonella henselae]OLL49915.1 hypothetical protein AT243_01895 [Bartonella henselae]OLL57469.1 hypothetical protein AT246_01055 [Bartonella henselae]
MVKVLKNQVFSIFIATFFSLSQIISTHASPLRNSPQQENISVSVMEQGKKIAINMAAFYMPNFTYEAKNENAHEGKIEKVFEPITLGIFTTVGALAFGFLTGSIMGIFTGILGWAVGKTKGK